MYREGALEHVASGKYTSLREAAREAGVSRHYLFFRTDSSHIVLNHYPPQATNWNHDNPQNQIYYPLHV
jgi:hypothetical protein